MLRITGYSDKYSAFPGEKVRFYVNSEKNENLFHDDDLWLALYLYFVKKTKIENLIEIFKNETKQKITNITGKINLLTENFQKPDYPFETEEEAISIANDTPYGLTNYIQTQDQQKANRVARKLRSGMVDVNGAGIAVDAPFGGYKHSGIGREAGALGIEEFLEVKTVGGWNDN